MKNWRESFKILPGYMKRRLLATASKQGPLEPPASPAQLAVKASRGKWQPAAHLVHLNQLLVEAAHGKLPRLIIQAPPRHGKSQLASVYFPAWFLGTRPQASVLLTSATDDLAREFSAACRDVLLEFGPRLFGQTPKPGNRSRRRWQTTAGGTLRAAGVNGDIMGRGADLLIVDDYFKNHAQAQSEKSRKQLHQWYGAVSSTRLSAQGVIVIIATRWHPDDLIGRLLKDADQGGDRWHVANLPALAEAADDPLGRPPGAPLWPARFDRRWLQQKQAQYLASGYGWMWEALYQQRPPGQLDAEWPESYFDDELWFDAFPPASQLLHRVMALDPSLGQNDKADYSAYVFLALDKQGQIWVDADLCRRDASRIVQDGLAHARRFQPDTIGVETNQFQALLADEFRRLAREAGLPLSIFGIQNSGSKRSRIRGITPFLAARQLRFKRNSPGAALLVEQLRGFPSARYDDGPDALEMGLRLLRMLAYEQSADAAEEAPPRIIAW